MKLQFLFLFYSHVQVIIKNGFVRILYLNRGEKNEGNGRGLEEVFLVDIQKYFISPGMSKFVNVKSKPLIHSCFQITQ